jgi:hypothetical protein
MTVIVPFTKVDDFIFPLIERVCKPRGLADEATLYVARCRGCGVLLNQAWLAMQASARVMGHTFSDVCDHCGSGELLAVISGLTLEEEDRLRADQFFKTLAHQHD